MGIARRLGLDPSEVDAMEHLMGDPVGPVELSRRLHMTSASATVLVDRLEDAGHVVREPDPSDGRRRVVRPTNQGARAVYQQIGPLVADLVAVEDGMSARDRRRRRRLSHARARGPRAARRGRPARFDPHAPVRPVRGSGAERDQGRAACMTS